MKSDINFDELNDLLTKYGTGSETETKTETKSEIKTEVKDEIKSENKISIKPENKTEIINKVIEEKDEIDRNTEAIRRRSEKVNKPVKKKKDLLLNILLVVFVLAFIGSGTYIGIYYYRMNKSEKGFKELKALIDTDSGTVTPEGAQEGKGSDYITYVNINGVYVQSKYASLYQKNNDFIGWLMVPDTNIDYPVMYTPDDEEFYLHNDFNKEYSYAGTLFLGKDSDIIKPSDNMIIYGHNMKAGTMFHQLLSYEKEEYYKSHKYIYFHTIENNGDYEVIAAFRTVINENDDSSFKYYEFYNADSEEEFNEFVETAKKLTPYDIPTTAEYGDKLLTLSTCAYHSNQGRYVIVAKKLD